MEEERKGKRTMREGREGRLREEGRDLEEGRKGEEAGGASHSHGDGCMVSCVSTNHTYRLIGI